VHASFFRFAVQDRDELSPADVVNGLGEHAARQSADVQIFVRDEVEPFDQRLSRLAMEVDPLVADALVRASNTLPRAATGVRPTLLRRECSLSASERLLSASVETRVGDLFSIGEDCERRETKVDARRATSSDRALRRCITDVAHDDDKPSPTRVPGDRHVPDDTLHETVLLETNMTDLRHANVPAAALALSGFDSDSPDPEGVVAVDRSEPWEARLLSALAPTEERLERIV
jgi:hypothetical protein